MQVSQCLAGLSKFAAHPQALEEVAGLGERGAGSGEVATQGVEAGKEMLKQSNVTSILKLIDPWTNSCQFLLSIIQIVLVKVDCYQSHWMRKRSPLNIPRN